MRTFIVRLQEDIRGADRSGDSEPRLRGIVDDVATGSRATFRNDGELVAALRAALDPDQADLAWDSGDGTTRQASPSQ